jgi:hypothetical protein
MVTVRRVLSFVTFTSVPYRGKAFVGTLKCLNGGLSMKGLRILSYIFIVAGLGMAVLVTLNAMGMDLLRDGPVAYGMPQSLPLPLNR